MKLRRLRPCKEDFDVLAAFLTTYFADEFEMGKLSAKHYDVVKGAAWLVNNLECAAWVVEDDVEGVVGSIGLHKTAPWYSNEPYLADGWLYVRPEFRKNRTGSVLVGAAMQFAEDAKLPLVVNVFNMEDAEVKIKALKRMGLNFIGGTFIAGE